MTALPVPSGAQDRERMMTVLTGFWVTQIVRAAATFNLADHLAAGTDTAEPIAEEESIDPDATRRLIRAYASLGLVTSADCVQLSGTSLLSTLLRDDPNSLRGMVLTQGAPGHWLTWECFPDAVRSNTRQMAAAHGIPEPTLMDMNRLVMNGGRERDIAEFDELFASTGLRPHDRRPGWAVRRHRNRRDLSVVLVKGSASYYHREDEVAWLLPQERRSRARPGNQLDRYGVWLAVCVTNCREVGRSGTRKRRARC